jgi:S-adenosyl-L-methionine hydrolase (adenosine-forming)
MRTARPVFLFTDFGASDVYVGQVKAVLLEATPESAVIDLLNDAPAFDIAAGAHLLAALVASLHPEAVVLAVIDPGVGSARRAVAVEADGRWFVGPDNGLISIVAQRARSCRCFDLGAAPPPASVSFHGRDFFAPAAARIARGEPDFPASALLPRLRVELDAGDLARIIYIDHYGNAMSGLRAGLLDATQCIGVRGRGIAHARVFSDAKRGEPFWYVNSIGLVEIAADRASAAHVLGVAVGDPFELI